jgi:translation initiation factor IF-3
MPPPRSSSRHNIPSSSFFRVNHKIRAREVRVIGTEGNQLGVVSINEALSMARSQGVDLVEVAANATPPVCRLVDYGKFRYEMAKKDKESKRHQHANRVKEIQLSPSIDPHDFSVKLTHAVDFLCEEMKVKLTLKFRGREMAHQEFGFQTVNRFVKELAPFGHPDSAPKLLGRGLNVMISPLPRNKRAKNPKEDANLASASNATNKEEAAMPDPQFPSPKDSADDEANQDLATAAFKNNPFAQLDVKLGSS